jgi:hypothetical protein
LEVLFRWQVLLNLQTKQTKLSKLKRTWRNLRRSFIEVILEMPGTDLSRWWVDNFMMGLRLLDWMVLMGQRIILSNSKLMKILIMLNLTHISFKLLEMKEKVENLLLDHIIY